jgi:polyhydroxybutyrate depolymerase
MSARTLRSLVSAAAVPLLLASACGTASGQASVGEGGVVEGRIRSGGMVRSYRLYVPANPRNPMSVVVVLHGGLQTPEGVAEMTGFDQVAGREGFLAVYPAGVGRTFNAGLCCGAARRLGVDDVGFVHDLLDRLSDRYDVDPSRIYATGISNGGLLAYRLACELPDEFAAVAPVAATLVGDCEPSSPVSILHTHGLLDRNIPFGGGYGPSGLQKVDWPPVRDGIHHWRMIDGCTGDPFVEADGPVTHTTWNGCVGGTSVELYALADGGHSWPGGTPVPRYFGPTSRSLDATTVIWRFFEAHPHA